MNSWSLPRRSNHRLRTPGGDGDALREKPVAHDQHRVRRDVRISRGDNVACRHRQFGTVMIDATALSLMTRMVWFASNGMANAIAWGISMLRKADHRLMPNARAASMWPRGMLPQPARKISAK